MELFLVKPDLVYYEQYNDMIKEWINSGTQLAPWFLDKQFSTIESFEEFIRMLDQYENSNISNEYSSTTSYFVVDEDGCLVGAASLRHYLTIKGFNSWGHIGYGVRPSERGKGYATTVLKMVLSEAKKKHIYRVLVGAHEDNIASRRVIEKCGGVFDNIVDDIDSDKKICRYWIDNR